MICCVCTTGRSKQDPQASPLSPGCSHANFTVGEGSVYRFRLISNALIALSTLCFEGHNVTVIALDATPIEPVSFGECVDINSGQRCPPVKKKFSIYKLL